MTRWLALGLLWALATDARAIDPRAPSASERARERYEAALERCAAFEGRAHESCVADARALRAQAEARARGAAGEAARIRASAALERCEEHRGEVRAACRARAQR